MYLEQLRTPHQEHLMDEEATRPRPILDVIPVDDIRRQMETARASGNSTAYSSAVVEALPEILEPIRRSMRLAEETNGPDAKTTVLETLSETGVTNCFGYTIVTSEALSLLGIEHWIATVGRHATTILPLPRFGKAALYVADGLSQAYNTYVTPALRKSSVEVMQQEMNDPNHPRGVGMLDMRYLPDCYELLRHKRSATMPIRLMDDSERYRTLVISTLHPQIGMRALRGTAAYYAAVEHSDYERAADAMREIPGLYYDIDARATHEEIKRTVAGLCESGKPAIAQQLIGDYCDSFARTKHVHLTELRADLQAIIALHTGDMELYEYAMANYHTAAARTTMPNYYSMVTAKADALSAAFRANTTSVSVKGLTHCRNKDNGV